MQGFAKFLLLFLLMTSFVFSRANPYNVLDYGAKGDSQTDDTQAILKSWGAACSDQQSPVLLIPSQKTFLLTKTVFQGPCNSSIHVQFKGSITAPNKIWADNLVNWITFSNINNLMIEGTGVINGQGPIWWACKNSNQCNQQIPYSFAIMGCQNVTISGLTFKNSPAKHLTLHSSAWVRISWLKIIAPEDSPNTDGMLIQESQHVEVLDSTIGTGDDCIAIGTGSSDVNITRIACGPGHGISIGSLGGHNSNANVEKIRVYNCSFFDTLFGVRIKTWQGGLGFARNISFEDIFFSSVHQPILIDQYYCGSEHNCPNSTSAVQISDMSFVDARGTTSGDVAIRLACSESIGCTGIAMRDVKIQPVAGLSSGREMMSYCLNAHGIKAGEITPDVPCLYWIQEHHANIASNSSNASIASNASDANNNNEFRSVVHIGGSRCNSVSYSLDIHFILALLTLLCVCEFNAIVSTIF